MRQGQLFTCPLVNEFQKQLALSQKVCDIRPRGGPNSQETGPDGCPKNTLGRVAPRAKQVPKGVQKIPSGGPSPGQDRSPKGQKHISFLHFLKIPSSSKFCPRGLRIGLIYIVWCALSENALETQFRTDFDRFFQFGAPKKSTSRNCQKWPKSGGVKMAQGHM